MAKWIDVPACPAVNAVIDFVIIIINAMVCLCRLVCLCLSEGAGVPGKARVRAEHEQPCGVLDTLLSESCC